MRVRTAGLWCAVLALGCGEPVVDVGTAPPEDVATSPPVVELTPPPPPQPNPVRNAYFGDLHVHTRWSFDAYLFAVRATPDDAYRYAKGGSLDHPSGFRFELRSGPLDFQAVTDHGMYLGVVAAMYEQGSPLYDLPIARELRGETGLTRAETFQRAVTALRGGELAVLDTRDVSRAAWQRIVAAAEEHNEPGVFTTFAGYEYTTSTDDRGNLHRNVIFRGGAPELPFSAVDSRNPEDLWAWLDEQRANGVEALAIPHNSNGSNGHMFRLQTFAGGELDAGYAELRMRNEPLVEVSQVKGTSEVHPLLSPNDEWADFEIFPLRIATDLPSQPRGSYVREAYLNGLVLQQTRGFNPFRFGLIGSTDTHNAGGTPEEYNYHSKVGDLDGTPQRRASVPLDAPGADGARYADTYYRLFSGSGLVGVWAEENTRDSLYTAMRRKETFATSGPRIRVRFFGGHALADDLGSDADGLARAYADGVPMGADLPSAQDGTPRFLVWALRDPHSAPLQRAQVVKGWLQDGERRERVYDVACSDGTPDPATHRCPDNGARVNVADCSYDPDLGAAELRSVWQDPAFDPGQHAFYYARILENPTCRWSTWDAIRAGVDPNPDLPTTLQERAWSSPIWYAP